MNFDHDPISMMREDIMFVPDDLFSSRSTLGVGKAERTNKVRGINKVVKETGDLRTYALLKE